MIPADQWLVLIVVIELEEHGRFEQQLNQVRCVEMMIETFLEVNSVPGLHPPDDESLLLRVLEKLRKGHVADWLHVIEGDPVHLMLVGLIVLIFSLFNK